MAEGHPIPQIAITLETNDWNSSTNNIADTLTDVEDLDDLKPTKIKSKLRIKVVDDGPVTDIEDLDDLGSPDIERDIQVQTISLDALHLDSYNVDENVGGTLGNISQNCKVEDQNLLNVFQDEGGLTDVENVATDEEPEFEDIVDADINLDDYHTDHINISTNIKQTFQEQLLEIDELTDVESVHSENEKRHLTKKLKTKKRKHQMNKEGCSTQGGQSKCHAAMARSFSQPTCLKQKKNWIDLESDDELESENFRSSQRPIHTVHKNEYKHFKNPKSKKNFGATEELILPPPIRTVIVLSENKTLVPTTSISPLDETGYLDVSNDEQTDGATDIELFADDDDFSSSGYCKNESTADMYQFEDSNISHDENHLNLATSRAEPLTDVEDLTIDERPKRNKKNKTLRIFTSNECELTENEDSSDSYKFILKGHSPIFPFYIKDASTLTISSKDDDSTSTTKNLLHISQHQPSTSNPNLTDVEDLVASADEDPTSDIDVSNSDFSKHLDQQRSSRIYIENVKKLDLDSLNEIMYLKGGACYQNYTDIEEISDENEMGLGRANIAEEWDVSKKSASQGEASFSQDAEQQGEESSFAAGVSSDATLKAEGEESGMSDQTTEQTTAQQRSITDQHQLSEEMKQLLKELEEESKQ